MSKKGTVNLAANVSIYCSVKISILEFGLYVKCLAVGGNLSIRAYPRKKKKKEA